MEQIGLNLNPRDLKARKIINKLKKGLPAQLKFEHLTGDPSTVISVAPNVAKKIRSSLRMGKGLRMKLSPGEAESMSGDYNFTAGGRISFGSIGRKMDKGLSSISRKTKRGIKGIEKGFKRVGQEFEDLEDDADEGINTMARRTRRGVKSGLRQVGREFEDFGEDTREGFKQAGREIKRGAESKTGRRIIKGLVDLTSDYVIPAMAGTAGAYFGADPEAMAEMGALGGDYLQKHARSKGYGIRKLKPAVKHLGLPQGKGFFKTLKKMTGINRSQVIKGVKSVARKAVGNASEIAGKAVAEATGNESAGRRIAKIIKTTGDTAIKTESGKKTLGAMAKATKREALNMGVEVVDDYIDNSGLPSYAKSAASNALKGKYPSASEFIDDVAEGALGSVLTNGSGMKQTFNKGRRLMGAGMAIPNQNVYLTNQKVAVYKGGRLGGESPQFIPVSGSIGSAYTPYVSAGTPMQPMKGGNGLFAGSQGRGLY